MVSYKKFLQICKSLVVRCFKMCYRDEGHASLKLFCDSELYDI